MDVNKLVRMANQIAANFDSGKEKDRDKASAATADHLTRFWTPDMRRQIVEYYRAGSNGGEVQELSLVAARAVAMIAEVQEGAVA